VDRDDRVVVIDRLPGLPLAIVAGQSYDDILAEWRAEAVRDGILAAVTALLGIGLLVISWHYAKRREQTEAALERSRAQADFDRAQLELVYDTAPVGLMLLDRELRYVRINRKMADMAGSHPETAIGRTVREVVPDIADKIEPIYRKVMGSSQPLLNHAVSGTTPAQPGVTRHWLCSYHPVFDAKGEVTGLNAVVQEVTELKRMDEFQARLMAAIEASPDFVGLSDADRRPTFLNRAGRRMLGIGEDEDLTQLRLADFYEETSRTTYLEEVRPRSTIEGAWQGELTMLSRDGREIPVHHTSVAHRDPQGKVDGYAIFIRDVADRRQAEERLARREEQFRSLIEHASDLISVVDAKGVITFQSPSSEQLGYRPEELVGHHFSEFAHPDDLEGANKAIAEALTDIGRAASAEFRIRAKDGSWRIIQAIGRNAMHRRAVRGIVINARDVTAIRQAEATRARLAAALDGAAEGFALFDPDDRLIYVNPEFRRLMDVVDDILVPGTRYEDMVRTAAERSDIPQVEGDLDEWLAKHMAMHRDSVPPYDLRRAIGGVWIRIRKQKLPDGSTFIGHTDITAEKLRAEELRQAQKMEVVGKLTAGVAHDFNNLLTAVIGNLEFLSDALAANSKLSPFVETAMLAAERGAKLVQQLLSFSRKQPLDPRAQDLGVVVGGMADLLRTTVGSRVALDVAVDDHLWLCKVDAHQLEHALLNLATNARDAMPDGGRLTITAANLRAPVPFRALQGEVAAGDYVVIAAADTGTGMADDVAARAIEPFFTTKEVGKGSGLGLSMVSGFAKQSGGDIIIESAPAKGTKIELYLPRADAASQQPGGNAAVKSAAA
jgi:PAS domain S-box-containing protein